jgi:hypothetical protein
MVLPKIRFNYTTLLYILPPMILFVLCLPPYWHSFFYYDDFNCFYLAQQEGGGSILGHVLNPFSNYFRPLYMLFYWVFWKIFFFAPLPYHIFSWSLHLVNLVLIFCLLQMVSGSAYAAGLIAILYSYQLTFREIYFNFACLGEPLCALLMLAGLLLYFSRKESLAGLMGCYILFFLALKTKEMAVTMPVILCLYELMVKGDNLRGLLSRADISRRRETLKWLRGLGLRLLIPSVLTVLYLAIKVHDLGRLVSDAMPYSKTHPYFLDFSADSLLNGCAWYGNVLSGWNLDPAVWLILWLGLAGGLLWRRNRWGLFWLAFIFVSFVPVIGLANRRLPYYWYIPFLGVAGLASLLVARLQMVMAARFSRRVCVLVGVLLVLAVSFFQWRHQRAITRNQMIWVDGVTAENRRFVQSLRTLPVPPKGSQIYFESLPRYFDGTSARSSVQVLFRDTSLNASILSPCPTQAACCLAVQDGQVIPRRWPKLR